MSLVLFRYVLTAAFRDRVFLSFLVALVIGICLSVFFGSSAVTEKDQFAAVYMGGGLRMIAVTGIVLFVVFHIRRSFEMRDVEFLLTRPLGREVFVLSHAAAFSALAAVTGLAIIGVVGVWTARMSGMGFFSMLSDGLGLWGLGLMAELTIVANISFFFSMVLTSPVAGGFACLGFYVLARMMGQLLLVVQVGGIGSGLVTSILLKIMTLISLVIPRLDLMVQTSWLVYGIEKTAHSVGYGFVFAQAFAFIVMIILACIIDLKRKQF